MPCRDLLRLEMEPCTVNSWHAARILTLFQAGIKSTVLHVAGVTAYLSLERRPVGHLSQDGKLPMPDNNSKCLSYNSKLLLHGYT